MPNENQDWDAVVKQRDMRQELIERANENILACERALKAAKYYVHKMRLSKYKDEMRGGEPEEACKAKYILAMRNYDVIIDLNFKGSGGGEHNDECVKKGWEDKD